MESSYGSACWPPSADCCSATTGVISGALLFIKKDLHANTFEQQAIVSVLLLYVASFAIGLGPVFWLMISEIYPTGVRSKAMAVSTVA